MPGRNSFRIVQAHSAVIEDLVLEAQAEIVAAGSLDELDAVRVRFLGRHGRVTAESKALRTLAPELRPEAGRRLNDGRRAIADALEARKSALSRNILESRLATEQLDVTLPGRALSSGGLHPVTRTLERIASLFRTIGFEVVEGPRNRGMTTTTSRRSTFRRTILRGPCRTRSISPTDACSAPTRLRCRYGSCSHASHRCGSSRLAACTDATPIRPTRRCSIRLRG